MGEDEYEIIAASPIRRLEKRLSQLESSSPASEVRHLIEQIVELIKGNQRVIDDIIKSDHALRNEVSIIANKVDQLVAKMNQFMDLLHASAAEDTMTDISKDLMTPVVAKIDELVSQNKKNLEINQAVLTNLEMIDKRLKRLYREAPAYREQI